MAKFNFKDLQIKSLKDKTSKLQEQFEKQARALGWPDEIIRVVRVAVNDQGIVITYPPHMKEQIDSLEYGELGVSPKPAIRRFTGRLPQEMEKEVTADVILEVVEGALL